MDSILVQKYVRAERIELSTAPWQGAILPLNHARNVPDYTVINQLSNFYNLTIIEFLKRQVLF